MTDCYLEIGTKKVFAGALDWPGWSRGARDEAAAMQSLLDYGPRYARVLRAAGIDFQPPDSLADMVVVERLPGGSGTDFGAPGAIPAGDSRPVDENELRGLEDVLQACWRAFDAAVQAAAGKELRKGPRGGGRERDEIVRHVVDAKGGYLSRLGWKLERNESVPLAEEQDRIRRETLEVLESVAHNGVPAVGPRGGVRWPVRYFVRREAWHVLDHAWEIEDRLE